ncbi:MAG: GNAT family N-acetyltransferase [Alteromonadaceae bacterium]|nr:GNAT family N-acetyltransferase [Alteromonadaceae bacterium]
MALIYLHTEQNKEKRVSRQIIIFSDHSKIREYVHLQTTGHDLARVFYLGDHQDLATYCTTSLSPKHYTQALGQEFDLVIFDMKGDSGFRFQSLLAVSGTVKANGTLCIIEPNTTYTGISLSYPLNQSLICSSLWDYLKQHIASIFPNYHIDVSKSDNLVAVHSNKQLSEQIEIAIKEQSSALQSIINHLECSNHKDKSVVVMAQRGRGKSHLLARLAFQLLHSGNKVLCIQQHHNNNDVFKTTLEHFTRQTIPKNRQISVASGELALTSPDNSLLQKKWDLILIDEAATYSLLVLKKIQGLQGAKVYSTTTHGYEGTGQGFKRIFVDRLSSYHLIQLTTAFRFQIPCPIESALALKTHNTVSLNDGIHQITKDPDVLLACYSLLSEAHYQTRPDDLQRLFDCPNTHCLVHVEQSQINGVLLYFEENLATASDELKALIISGTRRVQGHLGLQQLAHTYRAKEILEQIHWRINRIAVTHDKRRQGIASQLVQELLNRARKANIYVTSSFSLQKHTQHFWQRNGFAVIRYGRQANTASGMQNVIVMHKHDQQLLHVLDALIALQRQWANTRPLDAKLLKRLVKHKGVLMAILDDFKMNKRHFDNADYALMGLHLMGCIKSKTLSIWYDNQDLTTEQRYRKIGCHGKAELVKQIKSEI